MLWTASGLREYEIYTTDGSAGSIVDEWFDDGDWRIRWFALDGARPDQRLAVVPARLIREPDAEQHSLQIALPLDRLKNRPGTTSEQDLDVMTLLAVDYPYRLGSSGNFRSPEDVSVRSLRRLTQANVLALDGEIGPIVDYLVEPSDWSIRFMVIETGSWWSGRQVLVAPHWNARVHDQKRQVVVDVRRSSVRASPPYDPAMPVDRAQEEILYHHYGHPLVFT